MINTIKENEELKQALEGEKFSKSYNSFSGIDVKVLIGNVYMPEVQVVHFQEENGSAEGWIEYLVFQDDHYKGLLYSKKNITLAAADEFGNTAKMAIPDA